MGILRRAKITCFGCLVVLLMSKTEALAGGGFLPPVAVDVGSTVLSIGKGTVRTGGVLTAGVKWATIYPKRTSFDVGVGYVGTFVHQSESGPKHTQARQAPGTEGSLTNMHGGFLEFAGLAKERSHARAWVSTRAELLRSGGENAIGFATRVSAELWTGLTHTSRGGAIYGVGALGLWTEMGLRRLPSHGLVRQVSVGLSVRLPVVVASH